MAKSILSNLPVKLWIILGFLQHLFIKTVSKPYNEHLNFWASMTAYAIKVGHYHFHKYKAWFFWGGDPPGDPPVPPQKRKVHSMTKRYVEFPSSEQIKNITQSASQDGITSHCIYLVSRVLFSCSAYQLPMCNECATKYLSRISQPEDQTPLHLQASWPCPHVL